MQKNGPDKKTKGGRVNVKLSRKQMEKRNSCSTGTKEAEGNSG